MASRTFQFRLASTFAGHDLSSEIVQVELLGEDGRWQAQTPGFSTPPFRLHLIALLLCLRFHLVAEARERGIPLQRLAADLRATVSEHWDLEAVQASFQLGLDPHASPDARARASAEALAAMRQRMGNSPVPRNRPPAVPMDLEVVLEA